MEPPLRERRSNKRSLPGQQQPWAAQEPPGSPSCSVAQLTRHASGDPFDTLAVQMPLKSQELFYYCRDFSDVPLPDLDPETKFMASYQTKRDIRSTQATNLVSSSATSTASMWNISRPAQLLITVSGCSINTVVHDPFALRSTLIIAGLHYSWNTGHLQSYESTFLFHKVESMRAVNKWMLRQDPTKAAMTARQVVTLGFAEVCTHI